MTFTHAYNQGSWSGAVCVASRTMLITGKTLWHAERDQRHLAERYVSTGQSWPQRLQAAGYRACFTGKWHVDADPQQVFEDVRHVRPGMPDDAPFMYDRPHPGRPDPVDPADPAQGGHWRGGHWKGGRHWSEVVADDVIAMLPSPAGDDRPFFIYAAFNAPHDPRQSPREYLQKYPPEDISLPESFLPEYPFAEAMGAGRDLRDERLAPFPRTEHAIRAHRREYAAIITHLDTQIGSILDALDKLELTGDTRIIFTSDHGLAVGRHGLMGKQNMYDHSVRVPLLLTGPGLPEGKKITRRVTMQDIVPTTLSWAGAPTDGIEFTDLTPLVTDHNSDAAPGETPSGTIYGAYLDRQRMITAGDWKLIVYPQAPAIRLYNLANDPHELVDLADRPEHREETQRLYAQLKSLQAELDDPLELPEEVESVSRAARRP